MSEIQAVKSHEQVVELTTVVNQAFATVAADFGFDRQSAPTFPAFIGPDTIEEQIRNGLSLFGFFNEDRIIGSVGIRHINSDGSFMIERLAVLPGFRHLGIGEKLMEFAIHKIEAAGGKSATIEIVDENLQLKNWYIDYGFREDYAEKWDHLPFLVSVMSRKIGA